MNRYYLSIVLACIFIMLALLHFSWALGNTWGFTSALPTDNEGRFVLNPAPWESVVVGLALMLFGILYLVRARVLPIRLPGWLIQIGSWLIPLIFLLRAIGDFKYLGFFKTISSTAFARLDTIYYSPLCAFIAIVGIIILAKKA